MKTPPESFRLRELHRLCLLMSATLGCSLSACGTYINPILPVSECVSLLPRSITSPTPGATIPAERTVGALAVFADAQTGQLDKANDDKAAIVDFEARCQSRDRALIKSVARRHWWQN